MVDLFYYYMADKDNIKPSVVLMLVVMGTRMYKAGLDQKEVIRKVKKLSKLSQKDLLVEFNKWF